MRDIQTFDRKIRELVVHLKKGNPKAEWETVLPATSVMLFPEQIDTVLSVMDGNGIVQQEGVTATVAQWVEAYRLVFQTEPLRSAIDTALTRAWKLDSPKQSKLGGSPRRFSTPWWSSSK